MKPYLNGNTPIKPKTMSYSKCDTNIDECEARNREAIFKDFLVNINKSFNVLFLMW